MKTPQEEIAHGARAKSAYDSYIRDWLDNHEAALLNMVVSTDPLDPNIKDTLYAIKLELNALYNLESSIQSDIDTGRLAEISLSTQVGN